MKRRKSKERTQCCGSAVLDEQCKSTAISEDPSNGEMLQSTAPQMNQNLSAYRLKLKTLLYVLGGGKSDPNRNGTKHDGLSN